MSDRLKTAGMQRPVLALPFASIYDETGRLLGGTPVHGERQPDGSLRIETGLWACPLEGLTFHFLLREAMPHEP